MSLKNKIDSLTCNPQILNIQKSRGKGTVECPHLFSSATFSRRTLALLDIIYLISHYVCYFSLLLFYTGSGKDNVLFQEQKFNLSSTISSQYTYHQTSLAANTYLYLYASSKKLSLYNYFSQVFVVP